MSQPCRGPNCAARIEWAQFDASGKWAPFDTEPTVATGEKGESLWVLEHDSTGTRGTGLWARKAEPGETGYTCHYATCEDRDQFRKKG